jgi:leucyl aminopeptidase (aminopeptidase T)
MAISASLVEEASKAVLQQRLEEAVKVALKERIKLKRGENVIVETWAHGLELAREFVFQARAMGARPMMIMEDEPTFWRTLDNLDASKVMKVGAPEWAALSKAQAYVFLPGPADMPRAWAMGMGKYNGAFPDNGEWYDRAKRHKIRAVRMLWGYTSPERAAAYGVDFGAWRDMVVRAALIKPKDIRLRGKALSKLIVKAREVHITAPNGTDLRLRLKGRKTPIDDGSVSLEDLKTGDNITQAPAGQLWVAPDERFAQGVINFDRPTASVGGWVKGIRWEFKDGKLVARSFEENAGAFERPFAANKGDKDRVGMLVFGLNPEIRPGYPQDPIAAGCVTLTLGYNDEVGGKNKTDFSFSATLASATVTLDGKPVVEGGRLRTA